MPTTSALVPDLISPTASSSDVRGRATIATSPPDSAKRLAIAKPMPLEPPVTMAERPESEISIDVSFSRWRPPGAYPACAGANSGLYRRLVLLRFEPNQQLALSKFKHRPLDDRGL